MRRWWFRLRDALVPKPRPLPANETNAERHGATILVKPGDHYRTQRARLYEATNDIAARLGGTPTDWRVETHAAGNHGSFYLTRSFRIEDES